jgi:hypothetical protein
LSSKLKGTTRDSIKEFTEQYRQEHPEWFKNVISTLTWYYHPDLVFIILSKFESLEKAPDGWKNKNHLYTVEGISSDLGIKKYVEQYRVAHPEWFKIFMAGFIPAEHFHPDLCILIKRDLGKENREEAPKGWMTATGLKKAGVASIETSNRVTAAERITNPEWFHVYWRKGQQYEYFHPDLVKKIKEYIAEKRRG